MKLNDEIVVKIEKLSFGGKGVTRHNGMVLFVSDAAPGDELLIRITKLKKRYAEADTVKIIQAGPHRLSPPCPIAKDCGGCQWQHIQYEEQLNQKNNILKELFQKSKVINPPDLLPIIPSNEFRYRNRVQVRAFKKKLGFYKKATNEIIDAKDCLIAQESIVDEMNHIREEVGFHPEKTKYEIFVNLDQKIESRKNRAHGADNGFSQVNDLQNQKMIDWVESKMRLMNIRNAYDLYAGNGNFSRNITIADIKWLAVELNANAVSEGKKQKSDSTIDWHVDDVAHFLKARGVLASDSCVLLDPPRDGCEESVIDSIAKARAPHLLYISCNPTSFLRDIERLQQKSNYQLIEVQAIDMFPHTYHIELMSYLRIVD